MSNDEWPMWEAYPWNEWMDDYAIKEVEWEARPDYDELMAWEDSGMGDEVMSDEGGWGAWMGGELWAP